MSERWFSAKDAAAYVGRSPRVIHELTRTKRIPHRRVDGLRGYLFRSGDLDAWLAGAQLEAVEVSDGLVVRPVEALA
jgi:excisionase family DNA binding protein